MTSKASVSERPEPRGQINLELETAEDRFVETMVEFWKETPWLLGDLAAVMRYGKQGA